VYQEARKHWECSNTWQDSKNELNRVPVKFIFGGEDAKNNKVTCTKKVKASKIQGLLGTT
jgi:hypothetical protein